jgi:RimJ/RimL family protein N-acetyltransferase
VVNRIHGARLDLVLINESELRTGKLEPSTFSNPYGVFSDEPLPRENRVRDVEQYPEHMRWYFRIMVDRARNIALGSISFHGAPDERGMVEVGFGVAEAERGKGYATEALEMLWAWAVEQPEVKFLRYTVSPNNLPSVSVISKFDFPQIGTQMDDEDGLELIFELPVSEYRGRRN